MIKRKPGRPRKVESTVEGAIPEKRRRGRPPKAAAAPAPTVQNVNVFEYRVSVSNGYGADIKTVRANSVAIEEGKLILRYGSRVVGAFSTWDDLVEVEQPTPKIEVPRGHIESTPDGTGYQFQSNGTFPISATIGIADFPQQAAQNGAPVTFGQLSSVAEPAGDLAGGINGPSPE